MWNFRTNRVLVVDDEEFCLKALSAMLKNLDFDVSHQVDFCIDGREAVETIKSAYSKGFEYSLILTDFHMPFMNGIEATK